MIWQYERLWPEHPFVFHVPYQNAPGVETDRTKYVQTLVSIRATVLTLIADLDDEEWIYWCVDDKYPVRLVTEKILQFMDDASRSRDITGLLFCRRGPVLDDPQMTLHPQTVTNRNGDVYLERKGWFQIWLHQFLKVKALRYLFARMPEQIESPKMMDDLKDQIAKPADFRLLVTEKNFAIFGESTNKGTITRNCYESILKTHIQLPKWFQHPNQFYVLMGEL
jgi:hypothetical protein